ncbi:MAG: D-Ala-D-Ala carboxypeptidase family metallohydrolase [Hyphomicrobium sp.]
MSCLRNAGRGRFRVVLRQLSAAIVVACALLAAPSLSATGARADDLPFWEQGASASKKASKSAKQVSYNKASYNKPASKKLAKKSYAKASGKKLGGYAEATEPKKQKKKGVKVAALDGGYYGGESKKSLSGGSVRWAASSGCLDGGIKAVIYQVAANFGPVTVNSTCRNKGHNRSVGGAPKSKHLSGDAADFRVHGNVRGVYAYLKSSGSVGGLKHYGGGLFHIDNGDRRSW